MKHFISFCGLLAVGILADSGLAQTPRLKWTDIFTGFGGGDEAVGLVQDRQTNTYVLGTARYTGTGQDIVVLKYDSSGRREWSANFTDPETASYAYSPATIAVSESGDVYVTGNYWRAPTGLSEVGALLLKFNSDGVLQWHAWNPAGFGGGSIALDMSGNAFLGGSAGVAKYLNDGTETWTFSGMRANDAVIDLDGNLIAVGGTNNQFAVLSLSSTGTPQWHTEVNRSAPYLADIAHAARLDESSSLYIAGSRYGAILHGTLVKCSHDGDILWMREFVNPPADNTTLNLLSLGGTNVVFAAGTISSSAFVVALTPDGALLWEKRIPGLSPVSLSADLAGCGYLAGDIAGEGITFKFDRYSGRHLWQWPTAGDSPVGRSPRISVQKDGTLVATATLDGAIVSQAREQPLPILAVEGIGTITIAPQKEWYSFGDQVQLTAIPDRWYAFTSWNDGNTNQSRTIQVSLDSYVATFTPTTSLETVAIGGISRVGPAGMPSVLSDGEFIVSNGVTRGETTMIELRSTFPSAGIFYTLDESTPSFNALEYSVPFRVTNSCTLRAIAYSSDFATAVNSDPVEIRIVPLQTITVSFSSLNGSGNIRVRVAGAEDHMLPAPGPSNSASAAFQYMTGASVQLFALPGNGYRLARWSGDLTGNKLTNQIVLDTNKVVHALFEPIPTYALVTTTAGGGSIQGNSAGSYYEGSIINLVAEPATNCVFMYWTGDLHSTNSEVTVALSEDMSLEAVFGTTIQTTTTGPGRVEILPATGPFPFGSRVLVKGLPASGHYLARWGNSASGTFNPLTFTVTNPTPTISALFAAVPDGQMVLDVEVRGNGFVTAMPSRNIFSSGETVELTAIPGVGHTLSTWGDAASGYTESVSVVMNETKHLIADFVSGVVLDISSPHGKVTVTPGFPAHLPGRTVALNAAPDSGWRFTDWDGSFSGTNNPASLVIGETNRIIAHYEPTPGTIGWQRTLSGAVSRSLALSRSGSLIASLDSGAVVALDRRDGTTQWSFPTGGITPGIPTIREPDAVLVPLSNSNLVCLDLVTGSELWRVPEVESGSVVVIGLNGRSFVGAERIRALSSQGVVEWESERVGPVIGVGAGALLYAGPRNGYVSAVRTDNGAIVETIAVPEGRITLGGSALLIASGKLFSMVFYDPAEQMLQVNMPPANIVDYSYHQFRSTPVNGISDIYLIDGGPFPIYLITIAPNASVPSRIMLTSDMLAGGNPCITVGRNGLYAAAQGLSSSYLFGLESTSWAVSIPEEVTGAPCIDPSGTIYFTTIPGTVYAVGSSSIGGLALSSWPREDRDNANSRRLNQRPVFTGNASAVFPEGTDAQLPFSVIDPDDPQFSPTLTLLDSPAGALLDPTASVVKWSPDERAGPGTYEFIIQAVDAEFETNTVHLTAEISEINSPPSLDEMALLLVREGELLTFAVHANDPDFPTNVLTFRIEDGPGEASVDPLSGIVSWTPTEAQGGTDYLFTISVTDDGVPPLSATNSLTVTVQKVNSPPVLGTIPSATVFEGALVDIPISAMDDDLPTNQLSLTIEQAPPGAFIDADGHFHWQTTEADGPGLYPITVRLTDDADPPLSASQSFSITIAELNTAPQLAFISDQDVFESQLLILTNVASDADFPANQLRLALLQGPPGASLNPITGLLQWMPDETEGPSTNLFTVTVTDDGDPPLSGTNSFIVHIAETNSPPLLAAIGEQHVEERQIFSLTLQATDSDRPTNSLRFRLTAAPEGMDLNPSNGVLIWQTDESVGATTNRITVEVQDDGEPPLSMTATFDLVVAKLNHPPTLEPIANLTIGEPEAVEFLLQGADVDLPESTLTYHLDDGPAGAVVDPVSGRFSWAPAENQGPSTNNVIVSVIDDGQPPLVQRQEFLITVLEVNTPPSLAPLSDQNIAEGTLLVITNAAADTDLPLNQLTFTLTDAPPGMSISPSTGIISWSPAENQGPSTNAITIVVRDDGVPSLTATQQITVAVLEMNAAPHWDAVADKTIVENRVWQLQVFASDMDWPTNRLEYSLESGPEGATLDQSTGLLQWTPSEAQGPSTNGFSIKVEDDGSPRLSESLTFTVIVAESNAVPVVVAVPPVQTDERTPWEYQVVATDDDLPGQHLRYEIGQGPTGMTIHSTNGLLSWTPLEAQAPSTNSVVVRVSDDGQPSLWNEVRFELAALEVNEPPVLPALADLSIAEGEKVTIACAATDPDQPSNRLSYRLVQGPASAQLESNSGSLQWQTTEPDGGTTNTFIVQVTDDGLPPLSVQKTFRIVVREENTAPFITSVARQVLQEERDLTLQLTAEDNDQPRNQLTYRVVEGPAGLTVDSGTGLLKWHPSEAQGPFTNAVRIAVDDDGNPTLSGSVQFEIAVQEVNRPPVLEAISEMAVASGQIVLVDSHATDPDLPANRFRFTLVSGPPGAQLDATTGQFRWQAPEPHGLQTNIVTLKVEDNGQPVLSDTNSFQIVVAPEAPLVTITSPVSGQTHNEVAELSGTVIDNDQVNSVYWERDGTLVGQLTLNASRFRVAGLRLNRGQNRFQVTATDRAGNIGTAEVQVEWLPDRQLSVRDAVEQQEGRKVVFPIDLDSQGEVGGMSFIARYDPQFLTQPEVAWSSLVGSSISQVNYDVSGEVKATFSLPATAIPNGIQSLGTLTFRARSVPFSLNTEVAPELLDVSKPTGETILTGTDAVAGQVHILKRRVLADNNGNNRLDIGDATVIQRLVTAIDPPRSWDTSVNDLNTNNLIDSGDVIRVVRVVVGLDPQPRPLLARLAQLLSLDESLVSDRIVTLATNVPERALLLPGSLAGSPGEFVTFQVLLTNLHTGLAGVSFIMDYPIEAVRLLNPQSHRPGPLVPGNALALWNVEPGQNTYTNQTGRIHFGASSAILWPATNGILAELNFQVQTGVLTRAEWPLTLHTVEVSSDGFDTRGLPDTQAIVRGSGPRPVQISVADCRMQQDGFLLAFQADPGRSYAIEAATSIGQWTEIGTVTATANLERYLEKSAGGSRRFYRVRSW